MLRNRFTQHSRHEVNLISFRDLTSAIIGLLLVLIALLMIHVNTAAKATNAETERSSGSLRVEIIWPPEMNVDIDLWCKAPGDVPVGYSNKGGLIFNLVRDDLGAFNDLSGINYEVMYARGAPAGEYICNVHWYSNSAGAKEVPVRMIITYSNPSNSATSDKIIDISAVLIEQGEELTMARWKIDTDQKIVPGSLNAVQYPLRSARKG